MDWLRKNMRTIFVITIAGFVAGVFVGFGGYFFGGARVSNAIAEINGVKIPYRNYVLLFNRVMDNLRSNNVDITDEVIKRTRQDVVQDLIREEVLYQETKKYGIRVTDGEVGYDVQRFQAFQEDGRFSQQAYFRVLSWQLRMTPKEFEESRRRQIAIAKLNNLIVSSVKISNPELQVEYARKHDGQLTNFEKNRDKFFEELTQEKRTALINDWYRNINTSLKVKVFTELLGE
ncbi:MAG: SurA N-terminal domain-containing protein [Elusimicrobia bacterium]|nr:SurA N-terminal domain-containing protein [Nanoarchaeota archaeon]MBU2568285.1 SurA N-terminal domain-containing protein [Elusimicrobiota bacterium]